MLDHGQCSESVPFDFEDEDEVGTWQPPLQERHGLEWNLHHCNENNRRRRAIKAAYGRFPGVRAGIALLSYSMRKWVSPAFGTAMCTATAGFVTLMFRGNSFKTFFPILFLAVIVSVAIRFGNVAGLLSTVIAATIFAAFLFEPTLSLGVKDSAQRSNLIWMIVGGLAMSELLGSPPQARPHA